MKKPFERDEIEKKFAEIMAVGFGRLPNELLREVAASQRLLLDATEFENRGLRSEKKELQRLVNVQAERIELLEKNRAGMLRLLNIALPRMGQKWAEAFGNCVINVVAVAGNAARSAHGRNARKGHTQKLDLVKVEALRLYDEKTWRSKKQAANTIFEKVKAFASLQKNPILPSEERFYKTLVDWINTREKLPPTG